MNNIRAIFNISKIVTVCCIVVFFILILSIFALYLFGGEKLSVEDENMLKTQMDSVLDEYKSAITNFEKKVKLRKFPYLIHRIFYKIRKFNM